MSSKADSISDGGDTNSTSTASNINSTNHDTIKPTYALPTDPDQDDKATVVRLYCFARPHMRAFHCAWWGYFIAFNLWFAAAPLLSEIRVSLDISNSEIWTSSIAGVGGTVFMRFLLGPLCDKYGARVLYLLVLCAASIPTACTGLVHTATGLAVTRLCIGFAGGTFVMCQYWCSRMFTPNVVGTANATAAGWGNLGAGAAQLVMGSALFPLFKWFYSQDESNSEEDVAEKAWRTVSIVPAAVAFVSGIVMYKISDDAPRGNYTDLKKSGEMKDVQLTQSFVGGLKNVNTWLLFVQYACCFGVELTMNNAAALYFKDEFGQSTESAAAIASIFGWMNIFARGLGGFCSDKANAKHGMRGRLWVHTVVLFLEGSLILVFSSTKTLGAAIAVMVFFSLFVQMAEGSSYGIVPYVDPPITGSISGIVGAGGNTGAVLFSLGFRQLPYTEAFRLMGSVIIGSCFLSLFIFIKGHPGLICGPRFVPEEEHTTEEVVKPESDSAITDGSSDEEEGVGAVVAVKLVESQDMMVNTSVGDEGVYDIDKLLEDQGHELQLDIHNQVCLQ